MGSRTETAIAKFLEGYNCAQTVLYAFCDELQLEKNTALKLACGFGAGMGRNGEVCGAVSGNPCVGGEIRKGATRRARRKRADLHEDPRADGTVCAEAWCIYLP